jgi:hypothetical protein
MKSKDDHYTRDLLGNLRGRPRKLNAMSGAQRQSNYRKRKTQPEAATNQFPSQGDEKSNCTLCASHGKRCSGMCTIAQLGHKD